MHCSILWTIPYYYAQARIPTALRTVGVSSGSFLGLVLLAGSRVPSGRRGRALWYPGRSAGIRFKYCRRHAISQFISIQSSHRSGRARNDRNEAHREMSSALTPLENFCLLRKLGWRHQATRAVAYVGYKAGLVSHGRSVPVDGP